MWSTWKTRRAHFCGIPDKGRGSPRPPPARPAVQPPDTPDPRTRRTLPGCWRAWNPIVFAYTCACACCEKLQRPCSRWRLRKTLAGGAKYRARYGLSKKRKIPAVCSMRCLLNTIAVSTVTLFSRVIDVTRGRWELTFYCDAANRFFSPATPATNDYR